MNRSKLTRRDACRLLALAPFAPAAVRTAMAGQQEKPFTLQYILGSCMYGTLKLEEILPQVRKSGAESIDLWPRRHGDQREQMEAMGHQRFGELLVEHGVKLGMTTRYDLGPFGLAEEMQVVRNFGGRLLVTGSRGPKNISGPEAKRAVGRFVEEMKPHVAKAEEAGVTIGIENHRDALIATPDSLRFFAELARSPNLGLAMAPYHLPQDEGLLARLIEDLGPKLVHFYAWQHGMGCMTKLPKDQELLQMPGRGPLDFGPLLRALQSVNYHGLVEIFMHPVPRGIPILDTAEQVTAEINRARHYLEDCLRSG